MGTQLKQSFLHTNLKSVVLVSSLSLDQAQNSVEIAGEICTQKTGKKNADTSATRSLISPSGRCRIFFFFTMLFPNTSSDPIISQI